MDWGIALKSNKSITRRIAGYLLGYVLFLFLILWVFQIELLPNMYQEHRKTMVIEQVNQIGDSLEEPLFSKTVVEIAREDTACIRILRLSGTEILSLDFMPFCNLHNMSKTELMALWAEAEANGGSLTTVYAMNSDRLRRLVPSDATAIMYVQIFKSADHQPTAIFYNGPISPINNMLEVLQTELRWITLAAIALGAFMVVWVTRFTVVPITKIIEQTRRLKEQDYTVTFDSNGYQEVAELSELLNETSRTLEMLDKMRRRVLSNVSHDLRTPLSMIIAYSELMRDIPEENTPENVQVIVDEAKRLTDLVNDVLTYPEPYDMVTTGLNCTMFDFAGQCRQVVERYQRFKKTSQSYIRYEGPERLMIWADSTRLTQVIYNLLNNAVSHSGNSPLIVLRMELEDNSHILRVEVADNGKGIPKEKQELIWELNYTESDGEEFHGGIGLTIVRSILEQHHAQYGVKSEPGEGSTFWFSMDAFSRE